MSLGFPSKRVLHGDLRLVKSLLFKPAFGATALRFATSLPVESLSHKGEGQIKTYLPRGDFGLIMMSYFGIVLDLSSRSLISFISRHGTFTPVGYAFSRGAFGSATVLILGNSRIEKIVNLRFPLFRRCASSAPWGPPQTRMALN